MSFCLIAFFTHGISKFKVRKEVLLAQRSRLLTEGGGTKGGVRSGVSGGGAPGGKRGTGDPLGGGTPWPATRRRERACASAAFIAEELS